MLGKDFGPLQLPIIRSVTIREQTTTVVAALLKILCVRYWSSKEIANVTGMSVILFASRYLVYFANVPMGDIPRPCPSPKSEA
jgi:hypothetical protein